MKKVFVDFHVLQTVPPSCVNRDDTGSPKTAVYGGVCRARVSSQAWKRAMRVMFQEHFAEDELGTRTVHIVDMVAEAIVARDPSIKPENSLKMAEAIINLAGVSTKDAKAKALFFMSRKQADNLAELALTNPKAGKKDAQAALNKGHGVDVALFGRMVADDPKLNTEATAQVAHSLSTHKVENEYDYFTAVDDRSPKDNAVAGMLGTVEYNSATLYRYATVAAHNLFELLNHSPDAVGKTLAEFTRAFVLAMPTGRQNTFANRTLPAAVMVNLRTDQPVNLVGAFEAPVKETGEGFLTQSVRQLVRYAQEVYKDFGCPPAQTFTLGEGLSELGPPINLQALLKGLGEKAVEMLQEKEGGR